MFKGTDGKKKQKKKKKRKKMKFLSINLKKNSIRVMCPVNVEVTN